MCRVLMAILAFGAFSFAQDENPFAKPPANLDDALRARVTEFYRLHVAHKYRQAEAMVAEESKDGFYAASKPEIESFSVGDIAYSDNFTKAKVTIAAKMMISFFGMSEPKLMTAPFASFWKVEDGKWCWYIYQGPRLTPFGMTKPPAGKVEDTSGFAKPELSSIQHAVKVDRNTVTLAKTAGAEEKVTISNGMPGTVTLALDQASYPGLDLKLDKKQLGAGEKAVLTLRSAAAKQTVTVVELIVQPINQIIAIEVK